MSENMKEIEIAEENTQATENAEISEEENPQPAENTEIYEEENPMTAKRRQWSAFVEGPAADFFTGYKLEKMMIDDGSGNKAKFSRTKDDGIKVEYTSAVLL